MKNGPKKHFKINGLKFFKGRKFFAFLTVFFLLIMMYILVSNILFLGKQLNNAYNINVNRDNSLKFDFEAFQKLKLVRWKQKNSVAWSDRIAVDKWSRETLCGYAIGLTSFCLSDTRVRGPKLRLSEHRPRKADNLPRPTSQFRNWEAKQTSGEIASLSPAFFRGYTKRRIRQ